LSTKLSEKTTGFGSKLDSLLEDSDFSLDKMRSKIESTVDEVVDYFDDEGTVALSHLYNRQNTRNETQR